MLLSIRLMGYTHLVKFQGTDEYPLDACGYDDGKVMDESLLLGFEDDEEGAGFANDTQKDGLTGFHFLKNF